jgi:cyclohexanecarboxylate-CoA ligase
VEIRIVDMDTGRDLGPGEEGEILARGPECFVGYTNPELNEEAFQGRWFRTGDLGMLDEQGYLSITGRKKDIIIRSGENLSAKEIEDALHSHPKLAEVSVVGIPDPKTGERAIAVVTPAKDANEITLDEIRDFLIQKEMAKQKIPEGLVIVADLPKTPTGKVRKNILREQTAKKLGIGRYC